MSAELACEDPFLTTAERTRMKALSPYGPRAILPRTADALALRSEKLGRAEDRVVAERARVRCCSECGVVFQGKQARSTTCSRRCQRDAAVRRAGQVPGRREVTCEQCEVVFTARRSDARFCSGACRARAHRAAQRQGGCQ